MLPTWPCLLAVALSCVILSCRPRELPVAPTPPIDKEYMDLVAGGRLSITVPQLKTSGFVVKSGTAKEVADTVTISAPDLVGFQVSHYSIEGRGGARIRLKFAFAETTRDGQKTAETKAPELPFQLPRADRHIRLIYFVRSSHADHNMAVIAAKEILPLSIFTQRLRTDPGVCQSAEPVSCVWVPQGVAVRAE